MSNPPEVVHSDEGRSEGLRSELALAAERRTDAQQETKAEELKRLAHEHDVKQAFRRLIDPGIMRPNNRDHAFEALKVNNPNAQRSEFEGVSYSTYYLFAIQTLATLSDNLLREPENTKFRQFKTTNSAIKKRLVDVKGALEYAVAVSI